MGPKLEKAPFQPIAPNAPEKPSRDAVAAFAEERGAPSLEARRKATPAMAAAPATAKPAPRGPVARLNLEIPAALRPQLKKRAFDEDLSILAIVLRALAKDGFEIDPADLVADRRKG